jgi:hypothetical protein
MPCKKIKKEGKRGREREKKKKKEEEEQKEEGEGERRGGERKGKKKLHKWKEKLRVSPVMLIGVAVGNYGHPNRNQYL